MFRDILKNFITVEICMINGVILYVSYISDSFVFIFHVRCITLILKDYDILKVLKEYPVIIM